MKRTVKILLLLAFSSAILSGCNTARGVGEDIQDLGPIISHAASYFRLKKTIAAIFSVLVLSSVLTACNTTRGVGEDISDGGNAISGAATKAQN